LPPLELEDELLEELELDDELLELEELLLDELELEELLDELDDELPQLRTKLHASCQ
jgi:hypothetical protein